MPPNESIAQTEQNLDHNSNEVWGNTDVMAYDRVLVTVRYILDQTKYRPKIAIICGSGLAGLANLLENPDVIEYADIPHFPTSTVPGHISRLLFGTLKGVSLMLMQGRFHYYEGYPIQLCGMPVRVMKLCGIESLIVTNAAGGLNPDFKAGDIMIIKDHINLPGFAGKHPLKGPNDQRFGNRFFALNNCYDRHFRSLARRVAIELDVDEHIHEGVYTMLGGPNFETVAELRMLMTCGVDAVGMSTIPEVLVAGHCGIRVFAFSLITNECVLDDNQDEGANHEEVIQTAKEKEMILQNFVSRMIQGIYNLTLN